MIRSLVGWCWPVCGWLSVGGARVNGPINPLFSHPSLLAGLGSKVIANQAGPVKLTGEWVGPSWYNGRQ